MSMDVSIDRWTRDVAGRQWSRDDGGLLQLGAAVPQVIANERGLAEVHRLDLSLFAVFEEAALRTSGALVRRAPDEQALAFAAQQTLDEARHLELFTTRLRASTAATGSSGSGDEILIPPLRKFLELAYETADTGQFVDGLVLTNLVLEGMAYPLYDYEERYWRPLDAYLGGLIRSAFADETRHVAFGAALTRAALADDVAARARVQRLVDDARGLMTEVFSFYVESFVALFDDVARRHAELFAAAEWAPGRRIVDTPYEEQVQAIRHRIEDEHGRLMTRAGLS